jgi:outer membrane protein assembly factor BamD (BamD/ComL family)
MLRCLGLGAFGVRRSAFGVSRGRGTTGGALYCCEDGPSGRCGLRAPSVALNAERRTPNVKRRTPTRRTSFLLAIAISYSLSASAFADLLDDAQAAHEAGVPEVGITKARQFLATNPTTQRRNEAQLLLARCLIETRQSDQADEILKSVNSPEATFLKGQAALHSRRWKEAQDAFSELATRENPWSDQAKLGLANAQKSLGEADAAIETLEPLLRQSDPSAAKAALLAAEINLDRSDTAKAKELLSQFRPGSRAQQLEKLCLEGEIALAENDVDMARRSFDEILSSPDGRTARIVSIAQLGKVKILILRQEYEEAETEIEKLIANDPRGPVLPELFENLFSIYAHETNPTKTDLVNWAAEDPKLSGPDRPAYALFYLARLQLTQGLTIQAQTGLRDLIARFPNHPLAVEGALILGRQLLDAGDPDGSTRVLETQLDHVSNLSARQRFRLSYLLGEAYHRAGNISAARDLFLDLARKSDFDRDETLFNAAICSLEIGDETNFNQAFNELQKRSLPPGLLGDLVFTRGLLEAKTGKSSADETMRDFIKSFPEHPRKAQAQLVEAEIRLTEQPPDIAASQEVLRHVSTADNPGLQEQADRLKFFVAASDPSQNVIALAALAKEYLTKYPESSAKAEIRLKLGELYYRENDFPNAQTQFELVSEESPDSPLVETALFLAGEASRKSLSSSSLDRAITLFEEVYKLGGTLKFQARLEEALTMRQARQESEAIVLLDDLVAQNPPPDIRFEAIDNKGEAQFTLAAKDPQIYEEAIKTFDRLLNEEGVPIEWKQHAYYQKGKCLEKLNRVDEALAAYYDVLAVEGGSGDQLWFFRAGFDAAQILENQRSWNSAAAIYDKLSNTRGPRSDEAKNRLTRLRLEHFLWPE